MIDHLGSALDGTNKTSYVGFLYVSMPSRNFRVCISGRVVICMVAYVQMNLRIRWVVNVS